MIGEFTKTSLLVIATVFTGTGASLLAGADKVWGLILLILAVGILVLRGWLKTKGFPVEKEEPSEPEPETPAEPEAEEKTE